MAIGKNKSVLVYDIECDSLDVNEAQVKWFGAYSFMHNQYYMIKYTDDKQIKKLIKEHRVLVGFNNKEFDNPILENDMNIDFQYKVICDLYHVCKLRLPIMGLSPINYKLKTIIAHLKLDDQNKGDIDYKVFQKDEWTNAEIYAIKDYLKQDVVITKKLFEFFFEQFKPIRKYLKEKDRDNYVDIRASSASLAYRVICNMAGLEAEFTDSNRKREKIAGGHHVLDRIDRARGHIVSVDFTSAYPHAIMMGNLLSPADEDDKTAWTGEHPTKLDKNGAPLEFYNIDGRYKTDKQGVKEDALRTIFLERLKAKKAKDKVKSLAYKIIINCFSEDTEVLTVVDGLKLLKDCKVGELVYSINQQTEEVEIKPITHMYEQKYKGDMIHFKDRNKDLIVTPNHDMLVKSLPNSKIRKVKAENVKSGYYPKSKPIDGLKSNFINMKQFSKKDDLWFIKKDNPYYNRRKDGGLVYNRNRTIHNSIKGYNKQINGKWFFQRYPRDMLIDINMLTNDLFYLIGIVIAEGCKCIIKQTNGKGEGSYRIAISQRKDINPIIWKNIKECLDNLNIRYSICGNCFYISSKFWYDFFSFFKNSYECEIPDWVWKYDVSHLEHLHKGLYDGDGNKEKYRYTTASKQLRDDMIKLNLHLGYRCYYTQEERNGKKYWRIYRTTVGSYRKGVSFYRIKNPTNKIVCCSVADNATLMAGRNGRLLWSGNSLYGTTGNPAFRHTYDPKAAGACTAMVRTWMKMLGKTLEEHGFIGVYGFTDSVAVLIPPGLTKEHLMMVVDKFVKEIQESVPFPQETFGLEVDKEMKFMWIVTKNCYLWINMDDTVGYRSTLLDKNTPKIIMKLFDEYMAPKIVKEMDVNFTDLELRKELKKLLKDNLELAGELYTIKDKSQYASKTSLQYQISEAYGEGQHLLIPNLKGIGVGKSKGKKGEFGKRYCTREEYDKNNLTIDDIDLNKMLKHVKPFYKEAKKNRSLGDFTNGS